MRKRSSKSKKPGDTDQLSKAIVDEANGEVADENTESPPADEGKNPAAVALGRLGGKKGGKARAAKLTKERRSEIARKAAEARWKRAHDEAPP
jgi:hypothetical protein